MDKPKREDAPIKVYRSSWPLVFAHCLIGIPMFSALAFLAWALLERGISYRREPDGFVVVMLIVILILEISILWYLYILSFQTCLILYEDGLELKQGNAHFFVAWENMSRLGSKSTGKAPLLGIYLHNVVEPDARGILDRLHFGGASDFFPINIIMRLPRRWVGLWDVTVDTQKLSQTDFGRDLLHYAPQLFEYGKEKAKNG